MSRKREYVRMRIDNIEYRIASHLRIAHNMRRYDYFDRAIGIYDLFSMYVNKDNVFKILSESDIDTNHSDFNEFRNY